MPSEAVPAATAVPLAVASGGAAWTRRLTTGGMLLPAYGILAISVFLPLLVMAFFSILKRSPFDPGPLTFTIDNYLVFARRPYLIDVAWTSIQLGLWTTGLCVVIGLPAALALAKLAKGRSQKVLFFLIILPFWTNGLVRIFSWTMVLRDGGVLDYAYHQVFPSAAPLGLLYSFPAIVIGLVHAYLPYMILTCYLSVSTIDDQLLEAAQSLGARWPAVFLKIILPLAVPGIVAGSVLIFVPVIGSFMEPRILGGKTGVTMGTVIEDQFTQAFNWPLGSAMSFTMLGFILVLFGVFAGALRSRPATAA
jgi:spermidine/putrescine transport system permease protein